MEQQWDTFSTALIAEVFFPLVFSMGIKKKKIKFQDMNSSNQF